VTRSLMFRYAPDGGAKANVAGLPRWAKSRLRAYSDRFQTMVPVHGPIGATFLSSFPTIVTERF
jgi:hypothetical protein